MLLIHRRRRPIPGAGLQSRWFRQTEYVEGRVLRYAANAPNRHVIYGWLQVGEIIRGVSSKDEILSRFPQIEQHPHLRPERLAVASNTIFLGASGLVLAGRPLGRPGAGLFRSMDDGLVLTDEASPNRALWRLPEFMHPARGSRLSYHEKESRWSEAAGIVRLKSVGRGQEFVLTPGSQADMNSWLEALFEGAVQGRTA